MIDAWICKRLPVGAQENEGVFYLVTFIVASLVYHEKFLKENLHAHSELRRNVFMIDTVS